MGKQWKQWQILFYWDGDCSHEIKRCFLLGRKAMTNLDSVLKSKDITLPTKVCRVKDYGFSSSHVWIWELDHKESWVLKNWCFWTVVLEKTLESPLDCKDIQLLFTNFTLIKFYTFGIDFAGMTLIYPCLFVSMALERPSCNNPGLSHLT